MAKKRISMRKIKEVLRLRFEAELSCRAIALALTIGLATVFDYLERAKRAGLGKCLEKPLQTISDWQTSLDSA